MPQTLLSITIPAPELHLYPFLRHGRGGARFLWREGELTLAGIGAAAEFFGWGERRYREIETQAQALFADAKIISVGDTGDSPIQPHLFGGFSFTSAFVPDVAWAAFYPGHFMLPHYQLTQRGDDTFLTINVITPSADEADSLIPELGEGLRAKRDELMRAKSSEPNRAPQSVGQHYPMSYDQYRAMLTKAIAAMRAGRLDKVVLSRICEIRLDSEIALTQIFPQLDERYGDCIRFLFEPRPFHAFYGATPETLVAVEGSKVRTMGLAGSAPRGKTEAEDIAHGQSLLDSKKNQYEHALVVDAIRERLTPLTTTLDIGDQPELMKLGNIQHLYTPVEGELATPNGILPLVAQLHPTPALGGKPRAQAMAFIAADEPVTRGWYGAPVGIINPDLDGRFGVAIRSAVAQRSRVWAYAGGGIVADSDPEEEWEETAIKFRPMLEAFQEPVR